MLEWRQEDISAGGGAAGAAGERESVIVLIWPQGRFLLLPKGATAGARPGADESLAHLLLLAVPASAVFVGPGS